MIDYDKLSRNTPDQAMESGLITIAGLPGVGKSTLLSAETDAIFFSTNRGLNRLPVREVPCETWQALKKHLTELVHQYQTGQLSYKPVLVIDTADAARDMLLFDIQGARKMLDLQMHGQALQTWTKFVRWLAGLPLLVVMLCHTQAVEPSRLHPEGVTLAMSDNMARQTTSTSDIVIFADYGNKTAEGYERELRFDLIGVSKDRTSKMPMRMPMIWENLKELLANETPIQ